ncbi:hypothetical protein [Luteococcus sp.]|uniref:hypothetical protein n=1 Tax=Luteococcus sp. TaxID=1969402 RepID=UPI003735BA2F
MSHQAEQVPLAGGVRAQPAIAARARRLLLQLQLAVVVSVLGLGANVMASRTLLRFEGSARLWPMLANLAAILVLLVCLLQLFVWSQAQKEWTGRKDVSLAVLLAPSAAGRWLGVLCGLGGPLAASRIIEQTSRQEQAHWWALSGALCTIVATAFGAIQFFDPAGPRGVLPSRIAGGRQAPGRDGHQDETVVLGTRRDGVVLGTRPDGVVLGTRPDDRDGATPPEPGR